MPTKKDLALIEALKKFPEDRVKKTLEGKTLWYDDLSIVPKRGEGVVRLNLNQTQLAYLDMLTDPINPFEPRKTLKEIRAVRDVIVKGRQVGMTTFLCATLFIRAFTSRNHLVMLVPNLINLSSVFLK